MAEITPEQAIQAAKAAGLDTTGLEEQVARRAGGAAGIDEKVAMLESELRRRAPEQPATPEQRERAVADQMLQHLNESLTPWHTLGGNRG